MINKKAAEKKLIKTVSKNNYGFTFQEALIAIDVGKQILNDIGPIPELKGDYKRIYDRYVKFCNKYSLEGIDDLPKDAKEEILNELDQEYLHIECFLRWLQEDVKIKLVKDNAKK